MRISSCFNLAASLVLAALSSPLFAKADSDWSTDHLDDAWAEHALAHPELDEGWCQHCHNDSDHRIGHCEVREFSYPLARKPIAIDGGQNSGMTVMGWNRDHVRILYRVTTRARTEERTRALAAEVQLALTRGWLRPDGPSVTREGESWMVEVKAWVPRSSDLALSTQNGPLGVRDVHGRVDLSSVNGPVSLVDLGGAVLARIQNGPLHVALAGSRWDGAGLDAETENGPLNLLLSADYSARFETGTINGPRGMDYPIESNHRRGWITTTLGKGGPPVRVVTHNGPFQISYH
jgi:hypothetical protein